MKTKLFTRLSKIAGYNNYSSMHSTSGGMKDDLPHLDNIMTTSVFDQHLEYITR